MKQFGKRLLAVLSGAFLFGFTACGGGSQGGEKPDGPTSVWAAYGTEKILQGLDYSARHDEKTLQISTFRNEYESAQIVISAGKDGEYTLETADLTSASGEVLSKENFSVYHCKYLYLDTIKDVGVKTSVGYYPDALLPYDVAVNYKENVVEKGDNQSVWVTLHAGKEQSAGVYTGNFKVKFAGAEYSVPVSVTVYDYTLSDETHIETSFGINYDWISYAELESSFELMQKYYDFLLDHRISPSDFPMALTNSYTAFGENYEYFLDDVVEAAKDPRCSIYRLPTVGSSTTVKYTDKDGNEASASIACLDEGTYKKFLQNVAKRALIEDMDLFKKAYTYITFCDEYDSQGSLLGEIKVKYNYNKAKQYNADIANWIDDNLTCPESMSAERFAELKGEMRNSLQTMPHLLTGESLDGVLNHQGLEGEIPTVTFVPTIDKYASKEYLDEIHAYAQEHGTKVWTYTAVNPTAPFPTYHTEDQLLSSRLLNWMMYDYDITGNLFWSSVLYKYTGTQVQVQDYYNEPLRYPGMNGDGILMYPGRQYGIHGPVSSIRLDSIRDGNEDYDLLYELEEMYAARGVSEEQFDQVFAFMANGLYANSRVLYPSDYFSTELLESFASSRDMLGDLLSGAYNAGLVIENYEKQLNTVNVRVSAPVGVTLRLNGSQVNGTQKDGIVTYALSIDLTQTTQFKLVAEKDGTTYAVSLPVGKAANVQSGAQLVGKVQGNNASVQASSEAVTLEDKSVTKITLQDEQKGKPAVRIDVSDLDIDEKYTKVTLRVYNYGEEITLTVGGRCVKSQGYVLPFDKPITLQNGWNEITLNMDVFNCKEKGELSILRMTFGNVDESLLTEQFAVAIGEIVLEG